jgi:hypothetical protein
MSTIGNHVLGMAESEDYQFGWDSAERGEPSKWDGTTSTKASATFSIRLVRYDHRDR